MKNDLDRLMEAAGLDAILVTGPARHNPAMVYLTGGANLTGGDLIKKRGEAPTLFHYPMERDEAAKTGLATKNLGDYRLSELLREFNGDAERVTIERYRRMLADAGLGSGKLAIYGQTDAGSAYAIFSGLSRVVPGITIVGELTDSVLRQAMATKEPAEVERIRKMGQVTTEVVALVQDLLTSQRVKNDVLVKPDGTPLTIGEVKNKINLWLLERGAENPEGTIFAIGRDAGVPHSSGNAPDLLRLGQTIVFDIFPCESGGGYFYDFTRTWCLGYAPREVEEAYQDVLAVYQQVMDRLKPGDECSPYQDLTCDFFEARGHPTIKSTPQTESGYVHSLGHGVGLYIHERPAFAKSVSSNNRLEPGVIITVEPGLYYPERGFGIRLEDTVYARPDGTFEILADYPLDLVLPVKGG